jgi:hypothetical protein
MIQRLSNEQYHGYTVGFIRIYDEKVSYVEAHMIKPDYAVRIAVGSTKEQAFEKAKKIIDS